MTGLLSVIQRKPVWGSIVLLAVFATGVLGFPHWVSWSGSAEPQHIFYVGVAGGVILGQMLAVFGDEVQDARSG